MTEFRKLPMEGAPPAAETARAEELDVSAAKAIAGADGATDIDVFVEDGWQFSKPGAGAAYFPVYVGPDHRLRIGSDSLVARFKPNLPQDKIKDILRRHGLDIDRWIEPNETVQAYVANIETAPDVVAMSEALAAEPEVQYAEPVLHEALSRR